MIDRAFPQEPFTVRTSAPFPESILNDRMRVDRQLFERAREGCNELQRIHHENGLEFGLYGRAPHRP